VTDARLHSLHDGIVRLGPRTVHIDISNGCNTDCITCWDHSPLLATTRPAAWKRQRADAGFVAALLDDIQGLGGLEAVILSGMGEPFTHPQVYAMIADIKRRGLHLTIITNLVAADPEALLALGVDQLLIGIHAASAAAYLAFHPSFSLAHWEKLNHMLAGLRDAGRRYKHVQVIAACNARELPAMIALAARYEALQVNFKLASLRGGTEAARITDQQRAWLLDEGVAQAQERAAAQGVKHNLDVFRAQLEAGGEATAPIEDVGCFLGYEYSRITVDGTVLFCCNTEVVVGKLERPDGFAALWRGAVWDGLRTRLAAGRFFPGCRQCGKLNQNVKLGAAYRKAFGAAARPAESSPAGGPRRLPVLG
jgi:wyosine [tRNA(Phe)-imidazoG37] synthetase (radical SAM superfamily)